MFSLLLAALSVSVSSPPGAPPLRAPETLILGDPIGIEWSGLEPGNTVRLHALRRTTATRFENGQRADTPVLLHAWADYRVGNDGQVGPDRSPAIDGTYKGLDANGLLWSGWPAGDSRIGPGSRADLPTDLLTDQRTLLVVPERAGLLLAPRAIPLRSFSDRVRFTELTVDRDGVSGVFATFDGARAQPALIQLHGSEGGSMADARARAGRLAERGFSVLALNYVAYGWTGGIAGVEPTLANVPVEKIDRARSLLDSRPEVASSRIGLIGGSKGAEFALVAATRYPWIKAVVGCVPSDAVWAGYGREPKPGELLSSWTIAGKPLPFIPYDRYEDVFSGKATAAEVHVRSRQKAGEAAVKASLIPIERITAPILLLSGGKDEVWPSAIMSASIAAEAQRRRAPRVTHLSWPDAGHNICGTGTAPVRETGSDGAADAKASGEAFRATLQFLRATL